MYKAFKSMSGALPHTHTHAYAYVYIYTYTYVGTYIHMDILGLIQ